MCKHKYLFWLFSRQREAKMKSRSKKNCILNQQQFWNKKMTAWFASWHLGQVQKRKVAPGHQKRSKGTNAVSITESLCQWWCKNPDWHGMRSKKTSTQTQKKPFKKPILFCHMNTFASEDLKAKHPTLTFLTAKKKIS